MTRIFTDVITNMELPDEAIDAALEAYDCCDGPGGASMEAAIRAALQAMVDNGMAKEARLDILKDIGLGENWEAGSKWTDDEMPPALIIRLDNADERKRKEQP